MAAASELVFVGAPSFPTFDTSPKPGVHVLDATLSHRGSWQSSRHYTNAGYALSATTEVAGSPWLLSVGAPDWTPSADIRGAVFLLNALPADDGEDLQDAAWAYFQSPANQRVGLDTDFGALGGGSTEWILGAGGLGTQDPGMVYVLEPGPLQTPFGPSARLGPDNALRTLTGPEGLGSRLAAGDLDADGQDDLVVNLGLRDLGFFPGPWVGDLVDTDRAGTWTDPESEADLGYALAFVGDLTGDGSPDLAMGHATADSPADRAGWVGLADGPPGGTISAAQLAVQIDGVAEGDALGSSLASADLDGDGNLDLLVGAPTLVPAHREGAVLLFYGPLAGSLDASQADVRVDGQMTHDRFGRSLATTENGEVIVGEPAVNGGRVFLFDSTVWDR